MVEGAENRAKGGKVPEATLAAAPSISARRLSSSLPQLAHSLFLTFILDRKSFMMVDRSMRRVIRAQRTVNELLSQIQ